jgi:pimeloyl-ACP methyl ester carboxylesterase
MNTEFVRFYTSDGIELQGLYYEPTNLSNSGVIHIHGLAGNFYENHFIDKLAKYYTEIGYSFLTFNNRGHDYISDLLQIKSGDFNTVQGGGAYENFNKCIEDIDAGLKFFNEKQINKIILQGHSSGTNKIAFYHYKKRPSQIIGTILISPIDDKGILLDDIGRAKFEELFTLAKGMIKNGKEEKLMPEGSFYSYPMSAKGFYEYFKENSEHDIFRYRNPNDEFEILSGIKEHLLVIFGNDGEYVLGDIDETLKLLKEKAINAKSFTGKVVDGAPHNYLSFENKLALTINYWLKVYNFIK